VSDTVTFSLNGKDVTVPKGWTVMQAAKQENVAIPHFCYHDGLSIAGVCRFCMVKVEGARKLEVACNLSARDGMIVSTTDDEVKETHKWALEFHLVNHPLDCPICDQAGECGLQDSYMEVGKYQSQMTRPKVLKPKALDVGDKLVLDTERCILCSRCVRFEEEITKTDALGIFNRGDRATIGVFPEKRLEHDYQTNLVDICPVGAFTSKDFRFKQRVWFLKDKKAICPGCSTGCEVDVYGKPEESSYFRIKPRHSEVNGHWMCDKGRGNFEHMNPVARLRKAVAEVDGGRKFVNTDEAVSVLAKKLSNSSVKDIALLVSAQYTNEEYAALFELFVGKLGVKNIYQWREPSEKVDDFDGVLYRGDHNANTAGLSAALKEVGLSGEVKNQFDDVASSGAKIVVALAPELSDSFPSLNDQLTKLEELPFVSMWTINGKVFENKGLNHAIPMKGFAEKVGTFINQSGKEGKLVEPFPAGTSEARDVSEVVTALAEVMAHF
jgi:NADH-quinone oxidoreductase subunit G